MALRTRPRSARLLVIVLVSVSLMVITLDYRQGAEGPLSGLGRTALSLMAPLQAAVSSVTRPIGDFVTGVADIPTLRRENQELQDQLDEARAAASSQASLQEDYDELATQLGLATELDTPGVAAVVIANSPSNFEWTININRGTADGVAVGMPVIASRGLVGTVVRTTSDAAVVQLIIDRASSVAARIVEADATGELNGEGEGDMTMDFVSASAEVSAASQELIVETISYQLDDGSTGVFPNHIPIGTVSRALTDPSGLSKLVLVRPAVDFSSLRYVTVLRTDVGE